MKVTIERAALLKALGHVQSVVERRNTIPILSNVLFDADGEGLRLVATDLDLQVVETVPALVDEAGATTVLAHTLYEIVRKLPEGSQVEITVTNARMSVHAGRYQSNLATLPRDDFPMLAESQMPTSFSLAAATLRRLVDKTHFAISNEETRYYLNGIFLHIIDDELRAVATDGHRLACLSTPVPAGAQDMPGVIIPRKCVAELRKLLDEADGDIQIDLSDSKMRFHFDSVIYTSKMIEGSFPDYARVIPRTNDRILTIDRREMIASVDRVAAIASEKTRAIRLALEADKLTLSVTSPETGTADEELSANYKGEAFSIGFNARYLLDILRELDGDTIEMHMADAAAPTLIRDPQESTGLYVLMPMRV